MKQYIILFRYAETEKWRPIKTEAGHIQRYLTRRAARDAIFDARKKSRRWFYFRVVPVVKR
jgi:hypothetical protein